METPKVQILPTPVKSSNDKKDYKCIRLSNGLTALLVSDTSYDLEKLDEEEAQLEENNDEDDEDQSDEDEDMDDDDDEEEDDNDNEAQDKPSSSGLKKSAAGLCISMGSFSDPLELPGLAHFLEHMVFMGSKKFPCENSFDKFVSNHGGYDNAHTDVENTTFYFEIQRKNLKQGLDMFSQFFIEPLMLKTAMEREREAVDSEFQMALPSDYNRKQLIYGSLAKPGHPMGYFCWGNKKSLQMNNYSDDEVHKMLHDFKNRHYTAQSMTLVVQSQETIEALENLVLELFSNVPNNGLARESFGHLLGPFDNPKYHKLYKIAPMQNVYQLDLFWSLPPLLDKYRAKPLSYLSWIIGHEGNGSLIQYLRKNVWALSLYAGNDGDGFELNSTQSNFSISIVLTQTGFQAVDQVLLAVFSYLKMLNGEGPNQRIFQEIKEIEDLNFKFKEESQPMDNVEHLCENMQKYPSELIITGSDLIFDYDPDLIRDCSKALSPEKVCLFLISRDFTNECDQVEQWFKTNYKAEDIPKEWENKWKSVDIYPDLFLPHPNIFIAKDTDLKILDSKDIQAFPTKLVDENYGELFYKFDKLFNQPRAMIKIHVIVPDVRDSLENSVCMDLLISYLSQAMIKDTYPADIAQLEYSVISTERGFQIALKGLNDKLTLLLDTILSHFDKFKIDNDMFKAIRDQVKKNYYNNFIKPQKLVKELRLSMTQDVYRTACEKHKIISNVDVSMVEQFYSNLFTKPLYIQTLVQGNMTPNDAKSAFESVAKIFVKDNTKELEKIPEIIVKKIPEQGTKILRVNTFNPKDNNTLVTNYYQFGPGSMKEYMHFEVGCQIMEEPVFDILRTKEQLGYSVFSMLRNTHGILGISVTVNSQATKFTTDHVDSRIEAFLEWFINDKLGKLSDDEFNTTITTLIKMKSQADVTLSEDFERNWNEIQSREYLFDRNLREIKLFEECDKQKMVEFVTAVISKSNEKRRKLSVQVVGSSEMGEETLEDQPDDAIFDIKYDEVGSNENLFITNIETYKSSLSFYPLHKIIK